MRARVKPFVVCWRGAGSFTFRPRGKQGWLQTGIWAALILPLFVWFYDHTGSSAQPDAFIPALFLLCLGVLAWLVAGVWWLFAHAEINDLSVVLRDKQTERNRKRREQESQE
jgi:hypothetical protein